MSHLSIIHGNQYANVSNHVQIGRDRRAGRWERHGAGWWADGGLIGGRVFRHSRPYCVVRWEWCVERGIGERGRGGGASGVEGWSTAEDGHLYMTHTHTHTHVHILMPVPGCRVVTRARIYRLKHVTRKIAWLAVVGRKAARWALMKAYKPHARTHTKMD